MRSEGTSRRRQIVGSLFAAATFVAVLVGASPAAADPPVFASVSVRPEPTAAVVRVGIFTEGISTTWKVDYGTTVAYGSTVTGYAPLPGDVSGASEAGVLLSGLSPSTTYHYSVQATNASGTVSSTDATFTTGTGGWAAALTPAIGPTCVLASSSSSATVRGLILTYDNSTSWTVEYGTSVSYGSTVVGSTLPGDSSGGNDVTAALTGLTPGQTYHYRFTATDATGTKNGSDATFVAGAAATCGPTSLPAALGRVGAVGVGTSVIVTADVFTHGSSTSWSIDYGQTAGYGSTASGGSVTADTSGSSAVAFTITGLAATTQYHLRVTATNANGADSSTDVVVSTTTAVDRCILALCPFTGSQSYDSATGTVSGTVLTYGAQTTWSVEYGSSSAYGSSVSGGTITGDPTGATPVAVSMPALAAGTYHYRIDASSANGATQGADATFTVP